MLTARFDFYKNNNFRCRVLIKKPLLFSEKRFALDGLFV